MSAGQPPVAVAPAPPAAITPPIARLTTRAFVPPSCSLTEEDLRALNTILVRLAGEAADRQVATLTQAQGQSIEDFNAFVQRVRGLLELAVGVHGANGELIGGPGAHVLQAEHLPRSLVRVVFDSGFQHTNQTGFVPLNNFIVTLDFRRPRVLEGLLGVSEEANESNVTINGQDATWANGAFTELRGFFNERATHRDWLNSPQSYSVAALVGVPLSLYWVYRIDRWFTPSLLPIPDALKVAIYVYIVLVIMFVYRVTFNVARRTFPKLEGPERQTRGMWLQRTPLGVLVAGLLSDILFEIGKALLRLIERQ
jgi:hypothetical protein